VRAPIILPTFNEIPVIFLLVVMRFWRHYYRQQATACGLW